MLKQIVSKPSVKVVLAVVLALALVLSMTVLTRLASDSEVCARTRESLDEKKLTVLHFTEAAAAAATAIAALPGDATTPVADQLAELTSYFLVILAVIYIEECLVMLSGFAACSILIPIACVLCAIGLFSGRKSWAVWAARFLAFAVIIFALVPVSMVVSDKVEQAMESSFKTTIDEAQQITEEINENTDAEGNVLERFWDRIAGGVSGLLEKGKTLLIDFVKTIAVMLVTSCGIPIVVLIFMVWLVKMLFKASDARLVVVQEPKQRPEPASWSEEREEEYVP